MDTMYKLKTKRLFQLSAEIKYLPHHFLTWLLGSTGWQESFAFSKHGHNIIVSLCNFHKKKKKFDTLTNRTDDSLEGEYKCDTVHVSVVDPSTMKKNVESVRSSGLWFRFNITDLHVTSSYIVDLDLGHRDNVHMFRINNTTFQTDSH